MSLVTAAMLYSSRRTRQSLSIRAVLPDPTGLYIDGKASVFLLVPWSFFESDGRAYPPMPTVKALSVQSRSAMIGISLPVYEPGPSRISWL